MPTIDRLEEIRQQQRELKRQRDALLEACEIAYQELGNDATWKVSYLRLDVLRPAIQRAKGTAQ